MSLYRDFFFFGDRMFPISFPLSPGFAVKAMFRICRNRHRNEAKPSERVTLLEKLNKMVSKITTRSTKDLFCSNWNFFENFAAVKFLAKNFFFSMQNSSHCGTNRLLITYDVATLVLFAIRSRKKSIFLI